VSDGRVTFDIKVATAPTATNKARRVTDAATLKEYVEIPYNGFGLIEMRVNFGAAGDFAYSIANPPDPQTWSIVKVQPASSTGKSAGENDLVGIVLKLLKGPTPGAHPEDAVLTLKAVRNLPPAPPADRFESWATINIRDARRSADRRTRRNTW
jgi:hypothetical protein